MNEYIHSSFDLGKLKQYGFPIPVKKEILKENKMLAFDKKLPPEKLGREFPFWIDQSPVSHNKENNTIHAIDFLVPIGTDILAVDDGSIKYIKEDSFEYGRGSEFGDKANYIGIGHDNDIISEYIHLHGFSVNALGLKVGDFVKKGQIIGKTGWSGWMDIPHLHFALYKNIGSGRVNNIKIDFQKKLWWVLRYR